LKNNLCQRNVTSKTLQQLFIKYRQNPLCRGNFINVTGSPAVTIQPPNTAGEEPIEYSVSFDPMISLSATTPPVTVDVSYQIQSNQVRTGDIWIHGRTAGTGGAIVAPAEPGLYACQPVLLDAPVQGGFTDPQNFRGLSPVAGGGLEGVPDDSGLMVRHRGRVLVQIAGRAGW
jgi:hypothetical protein